MRRRPRRRTDSSALRGSLPPARLRPVRCVAASVCSGAGAELRAGPRPCPVSPSPSASRPGRSVLPAVLRCGLLLVRSPFFGSRVVPACARQCTVLRGVPRRGRFFVGASVVPPFAFCRAPFSSGEACAPEPAQSVYSWLSARLHPRHRRPAARRHHHRRSRRIATFVCCGIRGWLQRGASGRPRRSNERGRATSVTRVGVPSRPFNLRSLAPPSVRPPPRPRCPAVDFSHRRRGPLAPVPQARLRGHHRGRRPMRTPRCRFPPPSSAATSDVVHIHRRVLDLPHAGERGEGHVLLKKPLHQVVPGRYRHFAADVGEAGNDLDAAAHVRDVRSRCLPTPRCARTSVRTITIRHHTERDPATTAHNGHLRRAYASVRCGVTDHLDAETLSMSGGSCIFSGLAALEQKRPGRASRMQ